MLDRSVVIQDFILHVCVSVTFTDQIPKDPNMKLQEPGAEELSGLQPPLVIHTGLISADLWIWSEMVCNVREELKCRDYKCVRVFTRLNL